MKIRVLGSHNTESSSSRLMSLLVDDVLALDAGGLTSGLSFAAQMKIKALLVTHPHYDHIRDIPLIAMNAYLRDKTINLYSTQPVHDALSAHLLNDSIYPNFFQKPPQKPVINFTLMQTGESRDIEGYRVLTVPVIHAVPAVGYQITAPDGKSVFYTGDTGPGLSDCWHQVSPQLIIVEVTASDRHQEFARQSKHLTPALLEQELNEFQRLKGYVPEILAVHINPTEEKKIKAKMAVLAKSLKTSIKLATEGMVFRL
ncbi:MAG: MBL fold metallo-hydrolase [Dehalococcoidales bacterium]|nr:MBL fold metallo-hydrolase [Dehalococcoidales bacterium]